MSTHSILIQPKKALSLSTVQGHLVTTWPSGTWTLDPLGSSNMFTVLWSELLEVRKANAGCVQKHAHPAPGAQT